MIENCERDGWIATCPSCKQQFKSTVLKSWSGSWIVFYSYDGKYIYLNDFKNSDNIVDYVNNKLFDDIFTTQDKLDLNDFSINNPAKCPKCSNALEFDKNINPESVLWIDGQILIDGKIKKASRVIVNVNG